MNILWRTGHWDGPLSGVCFHEGHWCYFDTHEVGSVAGNLEDDGTDGQWCYTPRVWKIYRLTLRQKIEAYLQHWTWWFLMKIRSPTYHMDWIPVEHEEQIGAWGDFEGWPMPALREGV